MYICLLSSHQHLSNLTTLTSKRKKKQGHLWKHSLWKSLKEIAGCDLCNGWKTKPENIQYSILPRTVWRKPFSFLIVKLKVKFSAKLLQNHSWLGNFGNNLTKGLKLFVIQVIPTVFQKCLSLEYPCPLHLFILSSFITCPLYSTTSSYIYKKKATHS